MAVEIGRVGGYEYHHDFCVENEIVPLSVPARPGDKTIVFEIRTNFIIKTKDGGDEITGSERLYSFSYRNRAYNPYVMVGRRLEEYWMSRDEIVGLFEEALDFGKKIADDHPVYATHSVIPVVVKLDVCTVQQNGEPVEATKGRAIRAENLLPLHLCPVPVGGDVEKERRVLQPKFILFLWNLPRIRVTEVDSGVMSVCAICSRAPTVGAEISSLHPTCSHAFHSHCIVRRLLETNRCPTCGAQVYDPCLGARVRDSAAAVRSIMGPLQITRSLDSLCLH